MLSQKISVYAQPGDPSSAEDEACRDVAGFLQFMWAMGDSYEEQRAQLCREHVLTPAQLERVSPRETQMCLDELKLMIFQYWRKQTFL